MHRLKSAFIASVTAFSLAAPVCAETITLSTLEWPRHTGSARPPDGAATQTAGSDIRIQVLPWKRAIASNVDALIETYLRTYF